MTVSEWREHARERLAASGSPDPLSDAEWLLCDALTVSRSVLHLMPNADIPEDGRNQLDAWLTRREAGEPLQYIEGFAWFMGMRMLVDARVLIPRQDTETLCEAVLARVRALPGHPRVLDLCTGSGAIAAAINRFAPNARVTASDIDTDALAVARINAPGARIVQGDLFDGLPGEVFDVIACNPPYLSREDMLALQAEVRREPEIALYAGEDGLDFYRRVAREIGGHISAGGYAYFEIGYTQADGVKEIFSRYPDNGILRDLCGKDRVFWMRRE